MAHLLSRLWLYIAIFLDVALGFSFTASGSPFQCDDLSISWTGALLSCICAFMATVNNVFTGGTPPFSLIIVAVRDCELSFIRNLTILPFRSMQPTSILAFPLIPSAITREHSQHHFLYREEPKSCCQCRMLQGH
jgi:hypothetical protein